MKQLKSITSDAYRFVNKPCQRGNLHHLCCSIQGRHQACGMEMFLLYREIAEFL